MADPLDTILQTIAVIACGLFAAIVAGYLLDPNDYPLDRPPPSLAVYATCPMEAP